jgi:hypothetical protein
MDSLVVALRDPMARTILAVVAICVTMAVFIVGQWWWRRKALTYTVSITPLLTVTEEIAGRVQILFDGQPAKDVRLVVTNDNEFRS